MTTKKKLMINIPNRNIIPASRTANVITLKGDRSKVDIPEFLKKDGAFRRESAEGFTPLIDFEGEPGVWIIAEYVGARPDIGPNKSTMFDFNMKGVDGAPFIASLWGSTILDEKMHQINPQPGELVFVQYLGTTETKRGLSPAKDFRVRIVNPEIVKGMY